MEIIIGILLIIIGWLIYQLKQLSNQQNQTDLAKELDQVNQKMNVIETKILMGQEYNSNQINNLDGNFTKRSNLQKMELQSAVQNLELKLLKNNELSQKQVTEIIKQVQKLGQIETKMTGLEKEINDLTKVLDNKQTRGAFGEKRLSELFANQFGINNQIVSEQVKLSNDKRVDFLLDFPNEALPLAIDVKFPLDNFQKYLNSEKHEQVRYYKLFVSDVKNHIKVIAEKYLIEGETNNIALMFVPSEAIYYEILKADSDLLSFGYENNIWITSPSTIMALINIVSSIHREAKQTQQADLIKRELMILSEEFIRFDKRFTEYEKRYEQLENERKNLQITVQKIINKFNKINDGDL